MRLPWLLPALFALGATLAGCDGEVSLDRGEDGPIRLTYWCAQNPQERALAAELTEAWNREHPDVQVTVQPLPAGQSSEEVLLAAIVAGTTPDLCSNIWPGIMSDFVKAEGVLALDALPGFDSLMQARVPADLLERFRAPDGRVYQIPWKTNPIMMLYNEQIFAEAGVAAPPRTYSEYLAAAKRVTADRDGDGHLDRWMSYRDIRPIWVQRYFDFYPLYVAASGGQTLFTDGAVDIDAEAATEVFDFFGRIYAGGYFPITTFQGNAVVRGQIATEFTGPWSIGWLEENAPEGLSFSYAPVPVPDDHAGPVYTYGDYKNITIFSTTEHPEAAWRFAQYLVSKEADLRLLELTKQIPVRRDLLADSTFAGFFARNPRVLPFAKQAPYTRGVDAVPSLQEVLDAIAQQYEAAAVYRVVSPHEATERALDRIRLIHEWSL